MSGVVGVRGVGGAATPGGAPPFRRDRLVHRWLVVRAVSEAGDQVWLVALAWTAVHVASPSAAGLVVAAGTLPRALVLLLGGVLADRYDVRRVMVAANLARIAVLVAVAVVAAAGEPPVAVLVLAAAAFGVTDAVHDPSAATVGRQLVRTEDLASYSGLLQTLSRLGAMGGAAVGGFVVATWGLEGGALLNAGTFLVAVVFVVWWLRPRYPLERAEPQPVLRSLGQGLAHLRTAPDTRTLVIALSGLNLFVVPAETIGLALRAQEEGWGSAAVGVFLALLGAGAAVGAVAVMRWRPRRPATASFGWLVVQGLAIVMLGVGPAPVVAAAAALVGLTAGIASTLLSAVFAATVEGSYLGRMSSIVRLGDDVLMPLATIGFGVLAAVTSVTVAFAVYGTTMALVTGITRRRCAATEEPV